MMNEKPDKEKNDSEAKKRLSNDLIDQFELDEDFVRDLKKGMEDYDEALRDLIDR